MKGIVFNVLTDLIETEFGLETLDKIFNSVSVTDDGAYTAGGTYPDAELMSIVQRLSEETGVPVNDLVRAFGEYMFPKLIELYPVFLEEGMSLHAFLKSIHDVIHVEVKKLYPDSLTPTIEYEEPQSDVLVMKYSSPRKLCALSEGLIMGASKHFEEPVRIDHKLCMHDGHDHCRLEVLFQ